ncbi:Anoctamin-10 [Porphyridium purpureum]|uniref:Anoctamin-10 n=1 Tax=Porphyridium purpureum TaxID=35688 RepID=A0A5J4Z5Y6_PORPP|nr:Anoctamin-10 [Porphyridium purpureum]|eukprot:POR7148..scf295_1
MAARVAPIIAIFDGDTPDELIAHFCTAMREQGGLEVEVEKQVRHAEPADSKKKGKDAEAASVSGEDIQQDGEPVFVCKVSATWQRLMDLAADLRLMKRVKKGHGKGMQPFTLSEVDKFVNADSPNVFLTQADQLLLLHYATDHVLPDPELFEGVQGRETLLMWCERNEYVTDLFALHEESRVNELMACFSKKKHMLNDEDLVKFREYFGDRVALYFAFLSYYTHRLHLFAFLGVLAFVLSVLMPRERAYIMCAFALFASVWNVLFIAGWKRRNTSLTYKWRGLILGDSADEDLMSRALKEELRPQFVGEPAKDPITNEDIFVYPSKYKAFKYTVSCLITLMCLYIASRVMIMALDFTDINNFWIAENALLNWWSKPFIVHGVLLANVPLVLYLVALNIFDMAYKYIAHFLNDWENHKYEFEYDNALVLKLVLFQFIAMNMSYLYMAFVMCSIDRLFAGLRNVLMIELITGNVKEALIPYVMQQRKAKAKAKEIAEQKKDETRTKDLPGLSIELEQAALGDAENVFDDYFELTRQFAQINIFATAFPLGSALACANNHIEIFSDAFKRCRLLKRALPHRAVTIGSWVHAFDLLSMLSVITNILIISMTAGYFREILGEKDSALEFFLMVGLEHLIFIARVFVRKFVDPVAGWIATERAQELYSTSKSLSQ